MSQPGIIWADSCNNSSFYGRVISPGFSDFSRVHIYPGNGLIAVGTIKDNFAQLAISRNYTNIMRLTGTGSLVWSRFIGFTDPNLQVDARAYTSIVTANGDIVVVAQISAGVFSGNYVFRIAGNGNMLWQKKLPYVNPAFSSDIFLDMIETTDGGLLVTGVATAEGIVMKLTASGNFEWQKRIFSPDLIMNVNAVTEAPDGYYIAGTAANLANTANDNYVCRLSRNNGDVDWIKWLYTSPTALNSHAEFEFGNMNYSANVLTLTGCTSPNYAGANRSAQAALSIDLAGNFLYGTRIQSPQLQINPSYMFLGSTYDPYIKTGVQFQYTDSSDFYVFRLKPDLSTQWAWRIPMPLIQGAVDLKVLNDFSMITVGLTRDPSIDLISATMFKTAPSGMLEGCVNQSYVVNAQPMSASLQNIPNVLESLNPNAQTTDGTLEIINGSGFTWQLQCDNINACRLSKIGGPATVCKDSSNLFFVTRGGSCSGPVTYSCNGPASIISVNDSAAKISFSAEGNFVIHAMMQADCGLLQDSITVTVKLSANGFSLGADTTICPGNTVDLVAGNFVSYVWQDGSTSQVYAATAPGLYYVTVKDACGKFFKDSINVIPAPAFSFDLGPARIKCNDDTVHLSAPAGFSNYRWSPDYNINTIQGQEVTVSPAVDTAYTIMAEKSLGCLAFDTVRVQALQSPVIQLGDKAVLCEGDSLLLNAGPGFVSYLWNDGKTTQVNLIKATGLYSVNAVYNNGCKSSASIRVSSDLCLDDMYIPSAFTPNNDQVNDVFRPRTSKPLLQYQFIIYDRWGEKVFETSDPSRGWNGKIKSGNAETGSFTWVCSYQFAGERKQQRKGSFLLIK